MIFKNEKTSSAEIPQNALSGNEGEKKEHMYCELETMRAERHEENETLKQAKEAIGEN